MAETSNQQRIRDHYTLERGARLYRNNIGVLQDLRGIPVRYGLANDSEPLNRVLKSGDLIGWQPRLVTPDMVGTVIAEFLSIEVKPDGWKMPGAGPAERNGKLTAWGHVQAQLRWADLVRQDGGTAGIMIDPVRGFEY